MSRFSGPQGEGAMRKHRARLRKDAADRDMRTFADRTAEYRRITAKAEHHKASREGQHD